MSEEIELKPCPFCGAKVDFYEGDMDNFDYILCTECGFCMTSENLDSVDELINDWNRRPSPWISIDKELPILGEIVFVAIGELPEHDIGALTELGWITMNHNPSANKNIKYFMRKPELPKEQR